MEAMKRFFLSVLLVLGLTFFTQGSLVGAGKPEPINGTIFVDGSSSWGATVYPRLTLTGSLRPQQDLSVMLFCYQPPNNPEDELVWFGGTNIERYDGSLQVPTVALNGLPAIDTTQPGRCRVSLLLSTSKGQTRTSAELEQHDWFFIEPSS